MKRILANYSTVLYYLLFPSTFDVVVAVLNIVHVAVNPPTHMKNANYYTLLLD